MLRDIDIDNAMFVSCVRSLFITFDLTTTNSQIGKLKFLLDMNCTVLFSDTLLYFFSSLPVLVWEGGGEDRLEEGAEAAIWSNSSALALDARRAVRCGARLVRLQWRRADAAGAAAWRDADLTSLHHHREVRFLL